MKKTIFLFFLTISLVFTIILFQNQQAIAQSSEVYSSEAECKASCPSSTHFCDGWSGICEPTEVLACGNPYTTCYHFQCKPKPPVPTSPPSCGGPCTPNQTQCPIECPRCIDGNGTGNPICTTVITSTPRPSNTPKPSTPPKSPTPKVTTTPKPTSTPKPTATPKPTNTPSPIPSNTPTATPSPFPFADAMCKCDGIEIGQVAAGQDLKVTAYGKVEGEDTRFAKITSFSFFVAKGEAGSTDITIFNRSGPIASEIVSTSQNLVRNKASWTFKFPGNPEVGKEYRIWNQLKCERNTTGTLGAKTSQKVLAEETQSQSFVQRFLNFFLGIFGQGQKPEAKPTGFVVTTQSDDNDQLQLGTFKFGRIVPDPATACYMVKIKFDN